MEPTGPDKQGPEGQEPEEFIELYKESEAEGEILYADFRALHEKGVDVERINKIFGIREAMKAEAAEQAVIGLSAVHEFSMNFVNGSTDIDTVLGEYSKLRDAYTRYCAASDQGLDPLNVDQSIAMALQIKEKGELTELASIVKVLTGEESTIEAQQHEEAHRNAQKARQAPAVEGSEKPEEPSPKHELTEYRGPEGDEVTNNQLVALDMSLDRMKELCTDLMVPLSGSLAEQLIYLREEKNVKVAQVLEMFEAGSQHNMKFDDVPHIISAIEELAGAQGLESSDGQSFTIIESVNAAALSKREADELFGDKRAVETSVLAEFCFQFGFFNQGLADDATQLADAMSSIYDVMDQQYMNDALKESVSVAKAHGITDFEQLLDIAEEDFKEGNAQVRPVVEVDPDPSYSGGGESKLKAEEDASSDSPSSSTKDDDDDVLFID